MNDWPSSIVIVGGGTAGWLAALILGDVAKRRKAPCAITVVESSRIGTIGVGEGTTAVFRQMLRHLGIDEMEFLRGTGATIKYGIRHQDWRRLGHSYVGPIDDPGQVAGPGLDTYAVASGRPVGTAHLFQHLIDRSRAPFARKGGRLVPAGPFHHAYHFDQALAGAFLRGKAEGVTVIDDEVTGVETADGRIARTVLESGRKVEGDFFLDCSGFRRALIGELGAEWVSYGDVLPVNRAMPFWVNLKPGEEIAPVTLARAMKSGWMWRIPTRERYGCGYVYSDAHISPDEAKTEVEAALGHAIEPRNDIRIEAGRLREAWIGNCVAVGLASSFLEPLEATSIHGTVVQLMLLSQLMADPKGRARYNATHARQVDDFREFIRLHYVSERLDSPFWTDVAASHPKAVLDRVERWRERLPRRADFTPFPMNLPHVQEQLHIPVLDGLGLLDRSRAKAALAADPKARARLRKLHADLVSEYTRAAAKCLPHRAFLESLIQEQAA
jgi:tryptophan halogenase